MRVTRGDNESRGEIMITCMESRGEIMSERCGSHEDGVTRGDNECMESRGEIMSERCGEMLIVFLRGCEEAKLHLRT